VDRKTRQTYHVSFVHGGRHYSHSLKTGEIKKAEGARARLEENLADVERGRLQVPVGADLAVFLLSDGKLQTPFVVKKELTLAEMIERYRKEMPEGVKDASTWRTELIHHGHFLRLIGAKTAVATITTAMLQGYVNARATEVGRRGAPISHVTNKKEIGSLSSMWNRWAHPLGLVPATAPTKGLIYKKSKAKPPFQTL